MPTAIYTHGVTPPLHSTDRLMYFKVLKALMGVGMEHRERDDYARYRMTQVPRDMRHSGAKLESLATTSPGAVCLSWRQMESSLVQRLRICD